MKNSLLPLALTALLFVSCDNTDDNIPGADDTRVPADITAGITTRATVSEWEADDAIGIYMLNAATTDITEAAANRRYLTAAADGKFSPATADQTVYFPIDETQKVDFTAYYPYAAPLTGNVYQVDLSTQTTPAAIDLMTAKVVSTAEKPLDKNHRTVTFSFAHRLSRVEANITAGKDLGFTDADLNGLAITLSSQPLKADYAILTDQLTPAGETGLLPLLTANDGKTASAIILPQTGRTGRVLTFTMKSGAIFTWDVEDIRTFQAGKKTVFNITLSRAGVEVTATIQPWGTQDTVNDDIEI